MNSIFIVLFCSSIVWAFDSFENDTARIGLKIFSECAKPQEFFVCLKIKAVTILDQLKRVNQISVSDNVRIFRNVNSSLINDELTEVKLEKMVLARTSDKDAFLNQKLSEELMDLFGSSTLEISVPTKIDDRVNQGGEKEYNEDGYREEEGKRRKRMISFLDLNSLYFYS